MESRPTGRYAISSAYGEAVRAFVPDPLPPTNLHLSDSALRALDRATLALGRLDAISALVPDPGLFLYGYVRREAVLSSQIEGTQSSLSDLLMYELHESAGVPLEDVVEVSNYVSALEHGLGRLRESFPLSNRLIREVHGALLARGRGADKSPGEFRRSQNWIGGTRPGNAHFVPAPAEEVEACMADLERFLHSPPPLGSALIRAALAHVQFETIHPFLDGNGRVGRLLITLVLHECGALERPLLYLSLFLKQHRARYYALLDAVRQDGAWEDWLLFFFEGVEETASGAVTTARRIDEVFARDRAAVRGLGVQGRAGDGALAALTERPMVRVSDVARRARLSYPTARKGLATLERLGIAREVTGRQRDRVFAYGAYLALLTEEAPPSERR